jgi:AcrR family transcriptional regulator
MATALEGDRRRSGRPRGSPPNRKAILAAAREQFAERGYDNATIRGIAARASVDPALVHHYFGSKERLFTAAVWLPISPREFVPQLLAGGTDGLGERLLRRLFDVWASHPDALVGLVRSAASHEYAARMIREFMTREVLEPVARAIDMPQPRLRTALVSSQIIGLAMARFVVRLEPIASADPETLIASYAPTLQRYLTGPLPGDGA